MSLIHPTAIVEEGAKVHEGTRIGAFSIIESGAVVGPDCVIESHVRIYRHTRMGARNTVCHGATIGCAPQDLGYTPAKAKPLIIGDDNHFREYVNISHGVKEAAGTRLGNHNFLMAFSHIAHDCVVGDANILTNGASVGGHVQIGDRNFLSAHVAVHQFCRIGDYTMIGGVSGVRQDVPPYVMANGQYARFVGLNLVGLKRAGFSQEQRSAIKRAYSVLLRGGRHLPEALAALRDEASTDEVRNIVRFVEQSRRGSITVRRFKD
jgi:UDP-N-acetylglucosamine acyltransferase